MSANEKQVGGEHYKKSTGEQHWDRVWRLHGRGYFVGCATKYIERYHLKNGKQDLEKAIHFLQKLIELEYGIAGVPTPTPDPAAERVYMRIKEQMRNEPPPVLTDAPLSANALRAEAERHYMTWEGVIGNRESIWKCKHCGKIVRAVRAADAKHDCTAGEATAGYVSQ